MSDQTTTIGWISKGRERRCDEGIFAYKVLPSKDSRRPRGSVKIPRVWSLETPPLDNRGQRR